MADANGRSGERKLSAAIQERLALVQAQVDRLAFGSILLTIHDGRVVQLELTERQRFS